MNIWIKSMLGGLAFSGLLLLLSETSFLKKRGTIRYIEPILYRGYYSLRLQPGKFQEEKAISKSDMMDLTIHAIEERCNRIGYKATSKITSPETLDVLMTNIDDTLVANAIITGNSTIEFREVYTLAQLGNSFSAASKIMARYYNAPETSEMPKQVQQDTVTDNSQLATLDHTPVPEKKEEHAFIDFPSPYTQPGGAAEFPPMVSIVEEKDSLAVSLMLNDSSFRKFFPNDLVFRYGKPYDFSRKKEPILNLYAIRTRITQPSITNEDISTAKLDFDGNGDAMVMLTFNIAGTRKWERMTTDNVGKCIAILVNNSVTSAPRVNEPITGGISLISGGFTIAEAKSIAAKLSSGKLPVSVAIEKAEIHRQEKGFPVKLLPILLIAFVVGSGGSFLLLKMLKNK